MHSFQTTPQDLIEGGLYRKIAIACHPMPHRKVSLALIAKACGAVQQGTLVQETGGNTGRHVLLTLAFAITIEDFRNL